MQVKLKNINLKEANLKLAKLSPIERVHWAVKNFKGSLILPSSFGPTSPILLKLAAAVDTEIPVVTIRHGYETPVTTGLREWYKDKLDLNLHVFDAPKLPVPADTSPEFKKFKRRIKSEPFQRILDEFNPAAYLSGVMRWQNPERRNLHFIEDKGSVLAVNPILDMTKENVEKFFFATGLPKNDDYYDPAKGEHQSKECGLNTCSYN